MRGGLAMVGNPRGAGTVRLGVGETACLLGEVDGGWGGSPVVSLLLLVGGNIVHF